MSAAGTVRGGDRLTARDIADVVRPDDIEALTAPGPGPCASIFLPTHGGAADTAQDPIMLRNLLDEAEAALVLNGSRRPEARAILHPARRLLDDPTTWEGSHALALFLRPDRLLAYRLPVVVPACAVVGPRFRVRPLLPLLSGDGRFYVLALSQNRVRLLLAGRDHVQEVKVERLPRGLPEALRYDDPQKERLSHVSIREGHRTAIFHGHGIGGEVDKERIARFLHAVDGAMTRFLRDERAPLVLAGPAYECSIFRNVTRYRNVLDEGVGGNPDRLRPDELHARAWPIVEPIFGRARQEAAGRYRNLAGTDRATADLARALVAAEGGLVDVLFVPTDRERWGRFDASTGRATTGEEFRPLEEDLLERLAVRTFLTRGTVYAVPSEQMPDGMEVAAILRS